MIQLIKGFKDILPEEIGVWQHIETVARSLFEDFNFSEIRIPVLEHTALFARAIGEDTDIVGKEMYTFSDASGDLLTLRPEATAGIVRSYIQHKSYAKDPVQKVFFIGPMFRRERPQRGRYRQFYQINAEIIGLESAYADVELIVMLTALFSRLALTDTTLTINTIGCSMCRPDYIRRLSQYLSDLADVLCSDCLKRRDRNPLRVLDCKVPACKAALSTAPMVFKHLCPDCASHFETVKTALDRRGIAYVIDGALVRGLDYYTRTVFEMKTGKLGAQDAVAGGGRYDLLVEMLGGPSQPAAGFAVGFDRLVELTAHNGDPYTASPKIYVAALGVRSREMAFDWSCDLRQNGIRTEMDYSNRSLKGQMKRADKLGAAYVLIVGDRELEERKVVLRDMTAQEQFLIPLSDVVGTIIERMKTACS